MVSDEQYAALSEFRYRLAKFLRFSERAAREFGIWTTQYQLMLRVRAAGENSFSTVSELAERLDTTHQAAVALVKRCEKRQLITKRRSTADARKVEVRLTRRSSKVLQRLAARHLEALSEIGDVIRILHLTASSSARVVRRRRTRP
jgi:DNA-binding MarR family transcriptional regulator